MKNTIGRSMSTKIQFKLDFNQDVEVYLKSRHPELKDFRILSKSLDARGAPRGKKPIYLYHIEFIKDGEEFSSLDEKFNLKKSFFDKPIIIGAGPAGLFAALRFAEYGIKTTVIERGDEATKRMLSISKYWRNGVLNTESNVCYGEGGAGLFSDGKLITRVKSPFIKYVMRTFVKYGAPEEVEYLSNPHLGSNKIRKIITKISDDLRAQGHKFIYNEKVVKVLFEDDKAIGVELGNGQILKSDHIILATGHSAADMYKHLHSAGVAMQSKDFAVGVRVEHPRVIIDELQHGQYHESEFLGAARYRLSYHNHNTNKGTYSFCMCPGGYVLSSGTEVDGIVVNGMSNYARNSKWSNSALVVTVKRGEDFDKDDILAGLDFQQKIERKAYQMSVEKSDGKSLPCTTVTEFMQDEVDFNQDLPKTSSPSGIFKADLKKIFPEFIIDHLKTALEEFNRKIPGFVYDNALLIAPETRTSAPITILRDKKSLESTSHKQLYPAGEGAGYAGGITSAGVDGIRIVEAILENYKNE